MSEREIKYFQINPCKNYIRKKVHIIIHIIKQDHRNLLLKIFHLTGQGGVFFRLLAVSLPTVEQASKSWSGRENTRSAID